MCSKISQELIFSFSSMYFCLIEIDSIKMKPLYMYPGSLPRLPFTPFTGLVFGHAVSDDDGTVHAVALPFAGVAGVSFDGMDGLAVATLHDADVVAGSVAFPVDEDDIAGSRLVSSLLPLIM